MTGGKQRRGRSAGRSAKSSNDDVSSAPAPAPPPSAAVSNPTTTLPTTSTSPGDSVSTTTDSWSRVTAGSPHSRRAADNIIITTTNNDNNNNIISTTAADPPRQSTHPRGGIDFSLHPDLDLTNESEGGAISSAPTADDVSPSGGDGVSGTDDPPTISALFAELDLLRTQATNIQAQLDGQRAVSDGFARSITNMKNELQTLRDATTTNFNSIEHAFKIADESHTRILEFTSTVSNLTYQFHTVSTKVDDFIATQADTTTTPPERSSTIEEAFAAADAALSDGITSVQNEGGECLDRAHGVRFSNVTDKWSDREQYDSEAAYAAAHAHSSTTTTTSTPDSTTNREFSTRAQDYSSDGTTCNTSPRGTYGDSLSPRYNGPSSPRYRLAITRGLNSDILAWHAGAPSGGDAVDGIDFMEEPDVEALGVTSDLACGVAEDHWNIVTNWVNPRWMQRDSRDFKATEDGYTAPSTGGPNITDILKQISNWDKLSDLSPTGLHAFYNKLRRHSFKWKIALMPFGALNLKYQCYGHGLCTCGLGLSRYKCMGDALFLILEYLLPASNPIINTTLDTLASSPSTANGYTLLWTIMREFIPMLDITTPTQLPSWPDSDDIFQYARLILMYCDLAHHRGPPYTEAMRSRLFLSTVRGRYASLASQYTALVGTYCPGRDGAVHCSGPLPKHLSVLELARTFYDTVSHLDSSIPVAFTPSLHAHHTIVTQPTPVPDVTQASYRSPTSTLTSDTQHQPPMCHPVHIQGFAAHATRSTAPPRRRSAPNPTARRSRSPNRPRYESACEACGKYGHPANRCDMLAMALFIQRYARNRSNAELMKALEAQWVERNKPFLPRDDRSPRTILANYCAEFEYGEDKVDSEMDWDFLHDPSAVEEDSE